MDKDLTTEEAAFFTYCVSSGAFFHAFTALEHELNLAIHVTVVRFTKNQKRKAVLLAVLGGQRMAPAKDTINRLLRATKANQKRLDFAKKLFHELGEIQFLRDRLTHSLTVVTDEKPPKFMNMNFAAIRELSKFEDITFDVDALEAATQDMRAMRMAAGQIFNHYVRDGSRAVPELPAWQYKPSMLTRVRLKSPQNRKRQKRPPQSSPQ